MKLCPDYSDPNLGIKLPFELTGKRNADLDAAFRAYREALTEVQRADDFADRAMRSGSNEIRQVEAGTKVNPVLTVGKHEMVMRRGSEQRYELVSGIELLGERNVPEAVQFQGKWTLDLDGEKIEGSGVEIIDGRKRASLWTFVKIGTFEIRNRFAELTRGFRFALPMEGAVPGVDACFGRKSICVPLATEVKIIKDGEVVHTTIVLS